MNPTKPIGFEMRLATLLFLMSKHVIEREPNLAYAIKCHLEDLAADCPDSWCVLRKNLQGLKQLWSMHYQRSSQYQSHLKSCAAHDDTRH